jgi:D-aspartate ligase
VRVADPSTPAVVLIASPAPLLHGAVGVMRSLGRLGVPVYVAHDRRRIPTDRSRYLSGTFTAAYDQAAPDRFLDQLRGIGRRLGRRAVLIPIDDLGALFVADHAAALDEWFRFPHLDARLAHALASKRELHGLCRRLGVPSPETFFPQARCDVLRFLDQARPPVVVKAIDPLLLYQRPGARSVVVAHSREELLHAYDSMEVPERPNLMLQEYIPGGAESVWMFNGYLDPGSCCLVGFTGTKLRQCLPHTGPTSLGVSRRNPEVEQATVEFLAAIGYQGIVDLGWRYDARDRRYKLLDVNPRIGGSFRLFVATNGMDVARALYLDLTGQPVPQSAARDGRKWLVEPNDLRASLAYRREGTLTVGQWRRSLKGVEEVAWFAPDDPAPFLAMCRSAAAIVVAKAARSARDRAVRTWTLGSRTRGPSRQRGRKRQEVRHQRQAAAGHRPLRGVRRLLGRRLRRHRCVQRHPPAPPVSRPARIERLNVPEGTRLLEVGASAGRTAVLLAQRGDQVTAVDTTAVTAESARRHAAGSASSRLRVSLSDAHLLPFEGDAFSLVVALGMVPWLDSPDKAAREMARVLAPGGYVIVNADNRARLTDLLDPLRTVLLAPLRRAAKAVLTATALRRPGAPAARATYHRRAEFDRLIAAAGLERVAGSTFGFGPFTLLGRPLLGDPLGVRVNRCVQRLAERGVPGLRSVGAQYLVVARKPPSPGQR